jgi:hypothetical protein
VDVGIDEHLRVTAQVLEVRLGDHHAHGVGHSADPQLNTGAVLHLLDDVPGHLPVHLRDGRRRNLGEWRVFALDDVVDLADVNGLFVAAQAAGLVLVHFHDDDLGPVAEGLRVGALGPEVEEAVLVHGVDLAHEDVQVIDLLADVPRDLAVFDGGVIDGNALVGDFLSMPPKMPAHQVKTSPLGSAKTLRA